MIFQIFWFILGIIFAYIVYKNTGKNEHPIIWAICAFFLTIFVFLIWYLVGPGKNYMIFGGKLKGVG